MKIAMLHNYTTISNVAFSDTYKSLINKKLLVIQETANPATKAAISSRYTPPSVVRDIIQSLLSAKTAFRLFARFF